MFVIYLGCAVVLDEIERDTELNRSNLSKTTINKYKGSIQFAAKEILEDI